MCYHLRLMLATIFFLLYFLSSLFASCYAGWQIFTIQNFDNFSYWFPIHSLAIDKEGYLHLAYGTDYLYYLHLLPWQDSSSVWMLEPLADTEQTKGFAALVLDNTNHPHICYHMNGCLFYTYHDGKEWRSKPIDNSDHVGTSISMGMDLKGYIHVSYYDSDKGFLKHAYSVEDEWLVEVVDGSERAGLVNSLALDTEGNIHIAYLDWSNRDLKYAYKVHDEWVIDMVDANGDVGDWPSLAIDRDGHPHISYCDWTNRRLKYAYYDGNKWKIEIVDDSENVGGSTAIALDKKGQPHISYYNWSENALMYAFHDDNIWHTMTINRNEYIDGSISMVLDSCGIAHIVYYNYRTYDLKYIVSQSPVQLSESYEGEKIKKGNKLVEEWGCFLSSVF